MSRSVRLKGKDGLSKEIRKGVTVDQIKKHHLNDKDLEGHKLTPLIEAIKKGKSNGVI